MRPAIFFLRILRERVFQQPRFHKRALPFAFGRILSVREFFANYPLLHEPLGNLSSPKPARIL
jgi:hypothetical protein